MLDTVFATKMGMTQAWTAAGKRLAVTRCRVDNNVVIAAQPLKKVSPSSTSSPSPDQLPTIYTVGFGHRGLKNMTKPLRSKLEKSGFSIGVRRIKGVRATDEASEAGETVDSASLVGTKITAEAVFQVGDVVKVQGVTKGRGFAGAVKRHGFHGGPKTHGQSDRHRAVGSIGSGTSPGRVWKGKKMPGHYGAETRTVTNLVVLHLDPSTQELWLSGPVPGHFAAFVRISKTGRTKRIELDKVASGINEKTVDQPIVTQTEVSASETTAEEASA